MILILKITSLKEQMLDKFLNTYVQLLPILEIVPAFASTSQMDLYPSLPHLKKDKYLIHFHFHLAHLVWHKYHLELISFSVHRFQHHPLHLLYHEEIQEI